MGDDDGFFNNAGTVSERPIIKEMDRINNRKFCGIDQVGAFPELTSARGLIFFFLVKMRVDKF